VSDEKFMVIIYTLQITGCPEGWIAGPTSCYFLSTITTTQKKFALLKCKAMNGSLVNIESPMENHFISMAFANITGGKWNFLFT